MALPKELFGVVAKYASPEWVLRPWVLELYEGLDKDDYTFWALNYPSLWANPRAHEYCKNIVELSNEIASNPAEWAMDLLDAYIAAGGFVSKSRLAENTNPRAFKHISPELNVLKCPRIRVLGEPVIRHPFSRRYIRIEQIHRPLCRV